MTTPATPQSGDLDHPRSASTDVLNPATDTQQNLLDRVKAGEKWMICLTCLILLTGAFQAYETWRNDKSTSVQTDQLIVASKYNAYAARQNASASSNFAESARGIQSGVQDAAQGLQTQAAQIELSRKSSEAASNRSLDETISNFNLDQRAWLSVDKAVSDFDTRVGSAGLTQRFAVLRNSGKTPAHNVFAIFGTYFKGNQQNEPPSIIEGQWMDMIVDAVKSGTVIGDSEVVGNQKLPSSAVGSFAFEHAPILTQLGAVAPQAIYPIPTKIGTNFLTSDMVVTYGTVFYRDSFGKDRVTKFCQYTLNGSRPDWQSCSVHNEIE